MSAAPQAKDTLKFDIEIIKGPHEGLKMSFSKASVSIGRGPENDIVLSNDPRVSRQHAEIKHRTGTEFIVVNLSQKNFIMVNNNMVQSEALVNQSVIQIGDTEIRFKVDVLVPAPTPVVVPSPTPPRPILQAMPPSGHLATQAPTQPMAPRGYQSPPPGSARRRSPRSSGASEGSKARFYGIIGILVLVGWFLVSPSKKKNAKDPNAIRTSTISMQDMVQAEKRSQELLTIKKEKYDSIQYQRAQENFIKGFRDFQQGQYARAYESFQVVLNLDPENQLAERYKNLSKIKFDEFVKFNMIQGNRYREKKNWRMCQSNYSNVIKMLSGRKDDPTFKEAKQFYDECTLNLEGRF